MICEQLLIGKAHGRRRMATAACSCGPSPPFGRMSSWAAWLATSASRAAFSATSRARPASREALRSAVRASRATLIVWRAACRSANAGSFVPDLVQGGSEREAQSRTALAVSAAPAMPEAATSAVSEACAMIDAATEVMCEAAAHAMSEAVAEIAVRAPIIRSVAPVIG